MQKKDKCFCTAKTKRAKKDINVSAKVLRKCSAFSLWPPFLARQKFLENEDGYSTEIPCGSKISSKLLYLAQFSRYKHFCVLQILRKICKFKMATIFGKTKNFGKILVNLQKYPVGQKFGRNHSILHSFRDISIFVFCKFCEKFKILKRIRQTVTEL